MRRVGSLLMVLAFVAVLAAIWTPGGWLRWLLTALLLFFVAAVFLGQSSRGDGGGGDA